MWQDIIWGSFMYRSQEPDYDSSNIKSTSGQGAAASPQLANVKVPWNAAILAVQLALRNRTVRNIFNDPKRIRNWWGVLRHIMRQLNVSAWPSVRLNEICFLIKIITESHIFYKDEKSNFFRTLHTERKKTAALLVNYYRMH